MATKTRMTGCSRFLFAMIIIVPAAIIFSLWFTGKEITLDNITDPATWQDKTNVEVDEDKPSPIRNLDEKIKELKNKDRKTEPEQKPEETETEVAPETGGKRNIKDILNNIKPEQETEQEVVENAEQADTEVADVATNNADTDALQARISRLQDDLTEKDGRIEKLYKENETLRKRHDSMADSLVLIKGKLDKLKEALN